MKDVRLLLRQGDKSWILGTEDPAAADRLGQVTWRVQIPAEVEAGRAVLAADAPPRGKDSVDATLRVLVSQP